MKRLFTALTLLAFFFTCCKNNDPDVLPSAQFTYSKKNLKVVFFNTSTDANTYEWNYGDGRISHEDSPTHTYDKAGTYSVSLIARNGSLSDVYTTLIDVEAPQAQQEENPTEQQPTEIKPTADFSYLATGLSVAFTNKSKNAQTYLWDFNDGRTSTEANPTHEFVQAGTYKVTLTAKNITLSHSYYCVITITDPNPKAGFTYKTAHPLKAVFTNTSTNATSYHWDFGDGNTSTEKNPTHRYNGIGVYNVKMTATRGSKTSTYEQIIKIEAPTSCKIAGFVYNKIPTNNNYYQIQITDDYTLYKTTYLYTNWELLSMNANVPFQYTFGTPVSISISKTYVLRLYKSASKVSGEASGKGFWTAKITPSKLSTYPESTTYYDDNASITINYIWN